MTIAKIYLDTQVMLRSEMERMGLSYQELQQQDQILTTYSGTLLLKTKYTPVFGENIIQEAESQKYFLLGEDGLPVRELAYYEVYRKTDLDNSLYGQLDSEQYVNLNVFWPLWKKPFQVDRVLPVSLYQPQQAGSVEVKVSNHSEVLQFIAQDGKTLKAIYNKLAVINEVTFGKDLSERSVAGYIQSGWTILSSVRDTDQACPDYIFWR